MTNLNIEDANIVEASWWNNRQELEKYIEECYMEILRRCSDPNGKEHYTKGILEGKYRWEDLPSIFRGSEEYKSLKKSPQLDAELKLIWYSAILLDLCGYCRASIDYLLELDRLGVGISLVNEAVEIGRTRNPIGSIAPSMVSVREGETLMRFMQQRLDPKENVCITHRVPPKFHTDGKINIGYSVWETDRLPELWVEKSNLMDEIWVPSTFCQKVWRESGVDVPIQIIPHGVRTNFFSPVARPLEILNKKSFNFLSIFDWKERGGKDVLFRAYFQEFKPDEDVALILRVYPRAGSYTQYKDVSDEIARIKNDLNLTETPKILWVMENLGWRSMPRLYRAVDCYVMPTSGEGWSLTTSEAMASGLPVIVTNWSGPCDFMTPENSFPLKIDGLVPCDMTWWPDYNETMCWAEPSEGHLRELMRYVFEHRDEARKIGSRAREDMLEKWSWESATEKMIKRIQGFMTYPTKSPIMNPMNYEEYKDNVLAKADVEKNPTGHMGICMFRANAIQMLPEKVATILDLGCNDGTLTEAIRYLTSATVYGCEISKKAVEKAKKRGIAVFQGAFMELDDLPIVDCVYASHFLEHSFNVGETLDKIYSLTKKWFLVLLPITDGPVDVENEEFWKECTKKTHYQMGTVHQWTNLIEKHGFELLKHERMQGNHPRNRNTEEARFLFIKR